MTLDRALIGRPALGCALLVPILSAPVLAGETPVDFGRDAERLDDSLDSRGVMLVHAHSCGAEHPRR